MLDNPWQEVLDELYQMGGRAEFPSEDTEQELNEDVNLVERMGLSQSVVVEASNTLQEMSLAKCSTVHKDNEPTRYELTLLGEGYDFAHNRQQEKRNIRSNRSVAHLTLVLAFLGMGQAMALTARVSDFVTGEMAVVTTFGAGLILMVIYVNLLFNGFFNYDGL